MSAPKLPAIGARVEHYVDGDVGTVIGHDRSHDKPYCVVTWERDGGPCDLAAIRALPTTERQS